MRRGGCRAGADPVRAPIKPGLWQIHRNGKSTDKNAGHQRAHEEHEPGKARAIRSHDETARSRNRRQWHGQVCYTRESLEHSPWADGRPTARPTFSSRSVNVVEVAHHLSKVRVLRPTAKPIFTDSENYTVKSTSVSKISDKVRNSSTTMTAKWVGADCGGCETVGTSPGPDDLLLHGPVRSLK